MVAVCVEVVVILAARKKGYVMKTKLKIVVMNEDGLLPVVPVKKSSGAAGMDMYAASPAILPPDGTAVLVRSGIKMEIEEGWYGKMQCRSGFGITGAIYVGSGVIDYDYRGEVFLSLANITNKPIHIEAGQRVCQMTLLPVPEVEIEVVELLSSTERAGGGFGSTGK